MVELARSGRSLSSLAREVEPSIESIRLWVRQADLDEVRLEDGLTTAEREELRQLRCDVRRPREERDILKKGASWFAREAESVPKRSTDGCEPTGPFTAFRRCAECWASPTVGTYGWLDRKVSARRQADAELTERIRAIHARFRGTYGAPRLQPPARHPHDAPQPERPILDEPAARYLELQGPADSRHHGASDPA